MKNERDPEAWLRGFSDPGTSSGSAHLPDEDPLLTEGLEGIRIWASMTGGKYEDLKTALDLQVDDMLPVPAQIPDAKKSRRLKTVLAAALVCGSILTAYLFQPDHGPESRFAAYFRPLTHPDMTIRGNTDTSLAYHAVKAYETENYKQAIFYYEHLCKQFPNEEKHRLFLGIACLANQQPEKAVMTLTQPFTVRIEFEDDRQWYLALACLRINHFPEALTILKGLSVRDNYYREMSQKLLEKID